MILDKLENAEQYVDMNPAFARAFEFLRRDDLAELEPGRHEIDGDRVYAMVVRGSGRGTDGAKREAHRNYIDIQFSQAGTDRIGWKPISACSGTSSGYNAEKDCELFETEPDAWVPVSPGYFAVFFPHDVHAPLGADAGSDIHKIVVKVAVMP